MIAFLTLELHIEAAQSIKDKRQVLRSLKDRLRASFNVSVAELEASPVWNRATVGVVSISDSRDYLDGLMKNVERQQPWSRSRRLVCGISVAPLKRNSTELRPAHAIAAIALLPLYLPRSFLCARQ